MRAGIRKAEAAGLRVDGGAVAPQDTQVPLASIREMATGMRGNPAWGTLSEDLLAIDGRHDGDALGARRLIVRATADRILEAIDQPTMLVFSDLHWADEMSLEVIGELARHAADVPLLIVGDYRGDEFPAGTIHREWRSRILSQRHAEEARLRPLTLEETATATTLILGGELPAPRDVAEAIHQRTNGIPLHIEELLAALPEDARSDGARIREASVPDTIADAVLARVSRLSDEARVLARAGAVVGRCFSPDVIAGVVDRPFAELEPAIEELIDAAILRPFDYIDKGYYDFRHQLLRDAIYSSVPPSQLRRYHAQAAEFVMTLEAASVVHASRHYERAGLRAQAFRAALVAATEASRISARHEAYELYQRAIDNMPADLPAKERADLYDAYSNAAAAIERNAESVDAAIRARQLYLDAGMPLEAASMLLGMSILAARDGVPGTRMADFAAQALAEIDVLPVTPDREKIRAYVLTVRANDRLSFSDLAGARADALAARELAERHGDRETVLECDLALARIDIVAGQTSAIGDGLRAAREARDAGYESVGVTGYRNIAIMAARVLDQDAAEAAIREGLQYADAIEQSHCRQMMASTSALLEWSAGRWDEADRLARQELVELGCRRGMIGCVDVIGLVAMGRGRFEEAQRWLGQSEAIARDFGEVQFLLTPGWALAEIDLLTGNPAAAIERCRRSLELALTTGERALLIPFVVPGVRALLSAHRPDDAERWLDEVSAALTGWDEVAGPALRHATGLLRLATGSLTAARDGLDEAIDGWRARGRIWETTWARLDLAQCLLRSNRYGEAAGLIAAVRETADRLGSAPLAARADELSRVARGRGSVDEPWRPLTAREFEVARLIADGRTNAEIAEQLDIAPKTASAHVEHILAKLAVTRRAEIAAWAATITRVPERAATGGGAAVATRR
jgi:DNA-binding NarL/FixJ family response regulator